MPSQKLLFLTICVIAASLGFMTMKITKAWELARHTSKIFAFSNHSANIQHYLKHNHSANWHISQQESKVGQSMTAIAVHSESSYPSIALGCAITTKTFSTINKLCTSSPFFKHLLPSFCKTASIGFQYMFYIAYDFNDTILKHTDGQEAFEDQVKYLVTNLCHSNISVGIVFVRCNHTRHPAWAQNDGLMAAYHDNIDYLYMVNDDTILVSKRWSEVFIKELHGMFPHNVGLVGPKHSGGNQEILTYNFVHRTHVDIFGHFYPRNFRDWHADRWISEIYKPHNVKKMHQIIVRHTIEIGTRYPVHRMPTTQVLQVVHSSRTVLRERMKAWNFNGDKMFPKP